MIVFNPNAKPEAIPRTFIPGLVFDLFPTGRKDRRRLHKKAADLASGDSAKENEIYEDLLRKHMVRGWSGPVDEAGNPFPFSPEFIGPMLDQFSNLEMWVVSECETLNFNVAQEKALQLKNLNGLQDTSRSGRQE